jgi:hypothetical protein
MYLNNINKLKISLPSQHVENRHFEKVVQQYSVSTNKQDITRAKSNAALRASSHTNSLSQLSDRSLSSINILDSSRASSNTSNKSSDGYSGAKRTDEKIEMV